MVPAVLHIPSQAIVAPHEVTQILIAFVYLCLHVFHVDSASGSPEKHEKSSKLRLGFHLTTVGVPWAAHKAPNSH
jgi:hypothetical protein